MRCTQLSGVGNEPITLRLLRTVPLKALLSASDLGRAVVAPLRHIHSNLIIYHHHSYFSNVPITAKARYFTGTILAIFLELQFILLIFTINIVYQYTTGHRPLLRNQVLAYYTMLVIRIDIVKDLFQVSPCLQ